MNCFNHENLPAVGQCVDCGKFLCKECSSKYDIIICDECYQKKIALEHQQELHEQEMYSKAISDTKKDIIMRIVKSVVIFLVALALTSGWFKTLIGKVLFAYFVAGFPYGLKAYNSLENKVNNFIMQNIYNTNSMTKRVSTVFTILKLLICFAIGGFCFPVVLFKDIQTFCNINKLSD